MSKFLKVIVNIIMVLAILVAAAILIPPLAGVNTTIIDSSSMDTNLPVGSVTYSKEVYVTNIQVGDKILAQKDTSTYEYIVESADPSTGDFGVQDAMDTSAGTVQIQILNSAPRVIVTIPFIGYVVYAMHSIEGIMLIALAVLVVIVLFVLSELWKKETEEDFMEDFYPAGDEDEDIEYEKPEKISRRKKRRMEKAEELPEEDEEDDIYSGEEEADEPEAYTEMPEESEDYEDLREDGESDFADYDEFVKNMEAKLSDAGEPEEDEASGSAFEAEDDHVSDIDRGYGAAIALDALDSEGEPEDDDHDGYYDSFEAPDDAHGSASDGEETFESVSDRSYTSADEGRVSEKESVSGAFDVSPYIRNDSADEGRFEDSFMQGAMEDEIARARTADIPDLKDIDFKADRTFVPVSRPDFDDIVKETGKSEDDLDVREDSVTGVSVIDFSDLL